MGTAAVLIVSRGQCVGRIVSSHDVSGAGEDSMVEVDSGVVVEVFGAEDDEEVRDACSTI